MLFNSASAVFTNALTNNLDLRITATVPPDATDGPITIRTPHGEVTTVGSFVVLPPTLLTQTSPAGEIEISWAATGRSTLLEAAWDLTSGVWEPMTDSLVQTNGNTMFRPVTTAGKRFYRLMKQ